MSKEIDKLRDKHDDFDADRPMEVFKSPFEQFSNWFDQAASIPVMEVNAMVISTVGKEQQPSSRTVYLKELDNKGFVFFTNYNSDKGKHLDSNPKASALFFWPELHRQIQIRGSMEKVDSSVSDAYFTSRPRASKLGAWASHQSDILKDRKELEDRLAFYDEKFPLDIPRPAHWGGYRLVPSYFEFWQGRPSRLHDRCVFSFEQNAWRTFFKNP